MCCDDYVKIPCCTTQRTLERVCRIYSYLLKFKDTKICFCTHQPDYSDVTSIKQDWESVYGEVSEQLPADAPTPLGKPVTLTHYVDANLMHDILTGRSVTACLHFLNATPIDWYSKKMVTVETTTYGTEFGATRTCVEQIIHLRNTLRYLGVSIVEKSYMFGDNDSVVNSSNDIYDKLHKKYNIL